MKKLRFIFLLSVLFVFSVSQAQFTLVKSLGIEAGLSLASQNWNYKDSHADTDISSRKGVDVMLQLEGIQIPYLSLVAEVGYIEKGCLQEVENTTAEYPEGDGTFRTIKSRFEYFTASPMLKVRKEFLNITPYVFIGPRMDVQLGYTSDIDWSPVKDSFNKTVFGLNYGLGIEYKLSKFGVSASARHQPDFGKMFDRDNGSGISGLDIQNKAFVFNLGMKYFFN